MSFAIKRYQKYADKGEFKSRDRLSNLMNLFQRRGEKSVPKITTNHSFDQGLSDRSFSKSIKKIYSIFNVHESPDTARRLGENFLYNGSTGPMVNRGLESKLLTRAVHRSRPIFEFIRFHS